MSADEIARSLTKAQAREVPGYEGRYFVDADGIVYSIARTFERDNQGRRQIVRVPARRLVQCLNRNGYPFVRLYSGNKGRTFEVHRLVCRAFHGEPPIRHEVAHIDGDRENPSALNLRWATRAENHADKKIHGTHLYGNMVPKSKLTPEKAVDICQRALAGECGRRLAREFGVDEAAIRKIKNGLLWAEHTIAVRKILEQSHGQ